MIPEVNAYRNISNETMVELFGFLQLRKVSYTEALKFQEEVNQRVSDTAVPILVQLKKELDSWIVTWNPFVSNSVVKEVSGNNFAKAISSFYLRPSGH